MMYVKIRLTSETKTVDYCFMKPEVEVKELTEKINELTLQFDKGDHIKLAIGY